MAFIADLADMPDCQQCDIGLEERAVHAFFHYPQVRRFWDHVGEFTACIYPEHLVPINLAYVCDNMSPPWSGVKRIVFLTLLAVNGGVNDVDGGILR